MNEEYRRNFAQEVIAAQSLVVSGESLARTGFVIDLAVTLIIIVGMVLDHHSVTIALISGVAFFAVVRVLVTLTLSGTLTALITNGQNQRTLRDRDRLTFARAQGPRESHAVTVVEPTALPAETQGTFVSPHEQTTYVDAAAWLRTLYGADGTPDPKRVSLSSRNEKPGRIRTKHPSPAVQQLLLDRHIVHDLGNGLRLNLPRYSTLDSVRNALR